MTGILTLEISAPIQISSISEKALITRGKYLHFPLFRLAVNLASLLLITLCNITHPFNGEHGMNVLVIGGAGYIGSITNRLLLEKGYRTTVLDNLSRGHRAALVKGTRFIKGDLADQRLLTEIFTSQHFDAVMHFAALSLVGESVENPLAYYQNNVAHTITLLKEMKKAGIANFVFSSTAAVYGNPLEIPINEDHPVHPINPYGWSKCMVEQILKDASRAYNIRYVSLRYFNAAGAHPDGTMGEHHCNETHLIPLVLQSALDASSDQRPLKIYGTDYETPDGTCVRDYFHVLDLAEAHIRALKYLANGGSSEIFNLGNGRGFSVLEVIHAAEKITGRRIPILKTGKRAGDPPVLIASSEKISRKLGWEPQFSDLNTIIETAWLWHSCHPKGYENNGFKKVLKRELGIKSGEHQDWILNPYG